MTPNVYTRAHRARFGGTLKCTPGGNKLPARDGRLSESDNGMLDGQQRHRTCTRANDPGRACGMQATSLPAGTRTRPNN